MTEAAKAAGDPARAGTEVQQQPIPAITLGADAPESFPDPRPAARALSQRRWALHKERQSGADAHPAEGSEAQQQRDEEGASGEAETSAEQIVEGEGAAEA